MRLLLALLVLAAAPARAEQVTSAEGAELRGLDKITGRTQDFTLRVGDTVRFGRLEVSLMDCRYPTDDPTSNAYAQIIVFDPVRGQADFDGWMVASSPALSALDHPRYDVWVLRCLLPETAAAPEDDAAADSDATSEDGSGG